MGAGRGRLIMAAPTYDIRNDPRRRRWRVPSDLRPPLGRPLGIDPDVAGSFGAPTSRYGEDEPGGRRLVEPIDVWSIITVPASGSVVQLVELEPARRQHRTFIDAISPYLEGAGGTPLVGPRVPGVNVTIVWQLRIDGRPWAPYTRIDTILAPWAGAVSRRPLVELQAGQVASVWISYVDPLGVYAYCGVRVMGRFVPDRHRDGG